MPHKLFEEAVFMYIYRSESGNILKVLFSDTHQCKCILQTGVMMYNKGKQLVFTSNTENVFFLKMGM